MLVLEKEMQVAVMISFCFCWRSTEAVHQDVICDVADSSETIQRFPHSHLKLLGSGRDTVGETQVITPWRVHGSDKA